MTAAVACALALAGAAVGWFSVPPLAGFLLVRAQGRSASGRPEKVRRRVSSELASDPESACSSDPAALAAPLSVRLARGRADARDRRACAGMMAGALAGVGVAGCSVLAKAALAVCALAMATATLCDVRERIIPRECCIALAIAGAVYQMATAGPPGVLAGAAWAAFSCGLCWAVGGLLRSKGRLSVGGGDVRCMAALSVACGSFSSAGMMACFASAAAFSLAGIARGRLSPSDGIPFAPFLALWLLAGAAASLA